MVGNATVTAKTGPGTQHTSKVINNIKSFFVDLDRSVISFHTVNSAADGPALEYDLTGVATFTVTIAAGVYTITLS